MKKTSLATLALLAVTASWGFAFVFMKDAIEQQPIYDFLATRFTLAALIMIVARPQVLKAINKDLLIKGGVLGAILALAYITQTIGLELSTAAITGFLTGTYVVFTPILAWFLFKQKIEPKVFWGVSLAFVALLFISFKGFSLDPSQVWLLVCALLFAAHIVGLGIWSPGMDTYALTVVQIVAVAVISWVGALSDGYQAPPNTFVWGSIIFTAVFATAFAFWMQTWAQSIMDASRVAIVLTTEVIFTAVIAVAIGQEVLATRTIIGGVLMVAAMLVVEWPGKSKKPSPLDQTHFT
jgi:drug/metabolite transporter (DMT)-like permease